jgi:hypothetical protein
LTKGSLISITDTLVVVMSQSSVTTDHEWRYQLENNQVALGYSISHTIVWFDTIPTDGAWEGRTETGNWGRET